MARPKSKDLDHLHLLEEFSFLTQLLSDHRKNNESVGNSNSRVVNYIRGAKKPDRTVQVASNVWHRSPRTLRKSNASNHVKAKLGNSFQNVLPNTKQFVKSSALNNSKVWVRSDAAQKTKDDKLRVTVSSLTRTVNNNNATLSMTSGSQLQNHLLAQPAVSRSVLVKGDDVTVKVTNKRLQRDLDETGAVSNAALSPACKRTVCAPAAKAAGTTRTVLKSSRYKWSAKEKSATFVAKGKPLTPATPKTRKVVVNSQYNAVKGSGSSVLKVRTPSTKERSIRTKYTLIKKSTPQRTPQSISKCINTKYKVINKKSPKVSPYKFVRKVGKYSIKYVKVVKSPRSLSVRSGGKTPKYASPVTPKITSPYMKYHLIKRVAKEVKEVSSPSSKLVFIGGILYRSSPMHLSKTENKVNSTIKVTKLNGRKSSLITVRGVKFFMDRNGKTLKRIDGSPVKSPFQKSGASPRFTVSRIDLGGKTYIQKEPGILIQSQLPQARSMARRVVNRSINHLVAAKKKSAQFCMFYNRFGKCRKLDEGKCPYIHDDEKVAVCTRFLQGKCNLEKCTFSHQVCPSKMPSCSFFLRGRCNNDNCPYSHVNVNPDAKVCQDFLKGYCPRASECKELHTFSCPEFEKTGSCANGDKCQLKHLKPVQRKRNVCTDQQVPDSKVAKLAPTTERSAELSAQSDDDEDQGCVQNSSFKTGRLPSFVKLDDDELDSESAPDTPVSQPLRIKPSFLITNDR